jgi:hypothetical protein
MRGSIIYSLLGFESEVRKKSGRRTNDEEGTHLFRSIVGYIQFEYWITESASISISGWFSKMAVFPGRLELGENKSSLARD